MPQSQPLFAFDKPDFVPYGEIQGYAPGRIPAYSNKHDHFFSGARSVDGNLFCGYKYQCVEFARRWLYERKGLILPDVNWACHIIKLVNVSDAKTAASVPVSIVRNGTSVKPTADTLIIYPSSESNIVGHVGVITEVGDDYVSIADQNYRFHDWEGKPYGFRLKLQHDTEKDTWTIIDDIDPDDVELPMGWVDFPGVPNREEGAPPVELHESLHFKPPPPPYIIRKQFQATEAKENWLDVENPAEKLFIEEFGMDVSRSRLDEHEVSYYEVNQEMHLHCVQYGNELHHIFLEATDQVIRDDDQLRVFGIPEEFWPRLRYTYDRQRTYISGRFDFVYNNTTHAFKCFEYNADSASTLLECGRIQQKWADSIGLEQTNTRSSGFMLERNLRSAWERSGAKGRVHFCVDTDREEQYTALYCMEGAVAAGLEGKLCVMFDEFHFDAEGHVCDSDGVRVRNIWKTWMWESAIADYYAAREERGADWVPREGDSVRLCDLLLGKDWDVLVFEPMWKLIPSNKAILPLIYANHPTHPAILKASYELTPELRESGYAQKPIVGRVGRNVTITGASGEVQAASQGNFGERDMIYQELFAMEKQDDYYCIMGGWMIGDSYAGTGIREDHSIITGVDSPFAAMRIKMEVVPRPVTVEDLDKLAEDE